MACDFRTCIDVRKYARTIASSAICSLHAPLSGDRRDNNHVSDVNH